MKEQEFLQELKEISLLGQAMAILGWDTQTGMPEAASDSRGEVEGYLYGLYFERMVGPKIKEALDYFAEHPTELSELGSEVYTKVKETYELNHAIPKERMEAYSTCSSKAHGAWQKARAAKDFSLFRDALSDNIAFMKEFIPYWRKDEKTDYDVLLNRSEPNMTVDVLDHVFQEVRDGIMEIRKTVAEKGQTPKTDFLSRTMTKEQQRRFVMGVSEQLGYDFSRGRLDDTIHPFMISINHDDIRLTTRWNEQDFKMAVFGVIHEAGHGIYEQNIDGKYADTPLLAGTSNGIHESQSLFNEIIIGSNEAFWQKQYPFFQECAEGTFDDISFEDFYRGLHKTQSSFVRIEADSLTYPLHIIIRYEIEKMIFNDDVKVDDLPQLWNDKYEEYLGIRPQDDLEGILQDVHWSGEGFGYFPSYALGYIYAAQLLQAMAKEIDVDTVLGSDDYSPIHHWLKEHIHQYGSARKPNQLITDATGEPLNPKYLIDFMKKLYYKVYQVTETI